MRSAGLTTSVMRIPNFSFTTTTSPWATSVPLTNTSSGSPAARSSSTTEPWLSCSRFRIGIRVRPTSMDSVTGTSRITSRLTSWLSASVATASLFAFMISIPRVVLIAPVFLFVPYALLAARDAERAAEQRHAFGEHGGLAGEVARQHVAGLEIHELRQRDAAVAEQRGQFHFRVLQAVLEQVEPALILFGAVALHAGVEHLAQRLDHRIRHDHVQRSAAAVEVDLERAHHHHFRGSDDAREIRVDLRVHVLDVDL